MEGEHSANFWDGQQRSAARIQLVSGDRYEGVFAEAFQGRAQTRGGQGRSLDEGYAEQLTVTLETQPPHGSIWLPAR
jgi:hypothetical protein